MAFDLNTTSLAHSSEQGYTFEPVFPGTGQGIGATITVRGPHSAAVRELMRRNLAESQARELQAKKRGKDAEPLTLAFMEARVTEMACTFAMGWSGFEIEGQPVPFSAEAARNLFTAQPWIREQVIEEAQDLGNFISAASKNSSTMPAASSTAG